MSIARFVAIELFRWLLEFGVVCRTLLLHGWVRHCTIRHRNITSYYSHCGAQPNRNTLTHTHTTQWYALVNRQIVMNARHLVTFTFAHESESKQFSRKIPSRRTTHVIHVCDGVRNMGACLFEFHTSSSHLRLVQSVCLVYKYVLTPKSVQRQTT